MIQFPFAVAERTWRGRLSDWLQRGLDVLFPPHCVACSQVGTWLCQGCLASVERVSPPLCPQCGRPTTRESLCPQCRSNSSYLDGIRSAAIHDGALRQAIHHLKYKRRRELAPILGHILLDCWNATRLPADLVTPVPLHTSRLKERGFNQAGLLAHTLVEQARLALDETHLVRSRPTAPQVGLGAQDRQANVKDAFTWTGDDLTGVRVLLIDDVCTTGATLQASAQALRQAGAASVWALTLARAR